MDEFPDEIILHWLQFLEDCHTRPFPCVCRRFRLLWETELVRRVAPLLKEIRRLQLPGINGAITPMNNVLLIERELFGQNFRQARDLNSVRRSLQREIVALKLNRNPSYCTEENFLLIGVTGLEDRERLRIWVTFLYLALLHGNTGIISDCIYVTEKWPIQYRYLVIRAILDAGEISGRLETLRQIIIRPALNLIDDMLKPQYYRQLRLAGGNVVHLRKLLISLQNRLRPIIPKFHPDEVRLSNQLWGIESVDWDPENRPSWWKISLMALLSLFPF